MLANGVPARHKLLYKDTRPLVGAMSGLKVPKIILDSGPDRNGPQNLAVQVILLENVTCPKKQSGP